MATLYQITLLPTHTTLDFCGSRGNYYDLPDGTHLDMHTAPAWCRQCNTFTNAEFIESLQDLDQSLADLSDPTSLTHRATTALRPDPAAADQLRRTMADDLARRRRWRESRTAPPKCTVCGSPDIVPLPHDQPTPHPASPGTTVRVRCIGLCSTAHNHWHFTPEGDPLHPRPPEPVYHERRPFDDSPESFDRFLTGLGLPPRDNADDAPPPDNL